MTDEEDQADPKQLSKGKPEFQLGPGGVVFLIAFIMVAIVVWRANGDPLALVQIGTFFSEGNPDGTQGYDGQFVYFIARDPNPQQVAPYLDVPAYRYQRILLPFLARWLAWGNPNLIPWMIPLIGIFSLAIGTWAVGELLAVWGIRHWYALVYGLFPGFLLALIVDLPEPLAYGLTAAGLLAYERGRKPLAWALIGASLFAKEVTALFFLALLLTEIGEQRKKSVFDWAEAVFYPLAAGLPFVLFQVWLWGVFGQPGIGSGGAMSTTFEIIPFMGLWRIGAYSLVYLLAMLLVFGPAVVLPSVWGTWASGRKLFSGDRNIYAVGLFINALLIAFTPFSTFRETGGILRFSCGLMLALLIFAGRYHIRRALNYSVLWLVLNVFLLK